MTLAQIRQHRGFTQDQLAAEMGITQARVSAIERTPVEKLMMGTIAAYLEALGASAVELAAAIPVPGGQVLARVELAGTEH